ncbi:Gfo/Idh/MocA family protein [Halocatena pleomorpha]|uniref:Gfo/Idh/MocA family oxidoreductase n=1 Tax=Halocatena pleomorpha TaxID=1785090 RepID=A0A3P3RJT7_9EURY|nr:Gfo/Idh/MocA family oxidoreductase [Halocatena pleomorpha]RRJ33594.1 gfo/Idh/MocA family oxidoreductase [Halocatena pleomorpha]
MVGPIQTGIVGLGTIGQYHADQLTSLATQHEVALAGGMDIADSARKRFQKMFDVPTFDSHAALYEAVDAVIITTPNRYHEECAIAALKAGLDVLIEKPLAHTTESAQRITRAVEDEESVCRVGFHNRVANPVAVLVSYLRDGRFGEVYHIEANYLRRRGIPGRGSWFTNEATAGGGALVDIGAHAIDLALYLLEFPEVMDVSGVTRSVFGDRSEYTYLDMHGTEGDGAFDVDDSASAFIRCGDDTTIALDVAWAANRPPTTDFVLHGTEAGAKLDLHTGELTIFETDASGAPHFADSTITTREDNAHRVEQRRFLDAVAGTETPLATVEQALTTQRVLEAIYRSSDDDTDASLKPKPLLTPE